MRPRCCPKCSTHSSPPVKRSARASDYSSPGSLSKATAAQFASKAATKPNTTGPSCVCSCPRTPPMRCPRAEGSGGKSTLIDPLSCPFRSRLRRNKPVPFTLICRNSTRSSRLGGIRPPATRPACLATQPIPGILEIRQAGGRVCLDTPHWLFRQESGLSALAFCVRRARIRRHERTKGLERSHGTGMRYLRQRPAVW